MENHKCLIYCRVSSQRQVVEGSGLGSQEQRCREFAKSKGYQVVKVFPDEGISGGLFERPAMGELIKYLDDHPFDKFIIVFDDLSRLARGLTVYLKLKMELKSRGAEFECLNFKFEDTPEGEFIENVIASKAQLDREQNRRQVIQKQKARLDAGYWAFNPPPGLVHKRDSVHGKLLFPNEPYATIYKEAIESFRDGLLPTIDDVKTFINHKYESLKINKITSFNGARRVLTQILYAGYVEYKPWEVARRKGHYDGFITIETHDKVQEILSGNKRYGIRKDYNPDFPLRQLILCKECLKPLTASWNKGRNKLYANYTCKTKGCLLRYKSIGADNVKTNFESLLTVSKPKDETIDLANTVLNDVWTQQKASINDVIEVNTRRLAEIDKELETLKTRLAKATDEVLISVYLGEIKKLALEQGGLKNIKVSEYSDSEFGTAKDLVLKTLKNPMVLWKSDNGEDKRTVFNMYFGKKLIYDKDVGFGTVEFDPIVGLITNPTTSKNTLVETAGIEPASENTYRNTSTSLLNS
jgi:site-specific DNA recombinase